MPIQTDNKLWSEVLLKLFGNARPEPYRQTSTAHRIGLSNLGVRFTSKGDEEGLCEISETIQHA